MRLAGWCLSFALGIAASVGLSVGVKGGCALGAAIGAVGLWLLLAPRRRAVGGALIWLGFGLAYASLARAPLKLSAVAAAAVTSDQPAAIVARVTHGPEAAARGARLLLQLETIDRRPSPERLSLSVVSGWPDFGPGDRLRFGARLRSLRGLANPGLPDSTLGFRSAGVDLLAGVGDPSALERLPPAVGAGAASWPARAVSGVRALAFRARRAMRASIDRVFPASPGHDEGAFLRTAVLGDRRGVDDAVEAGFRAAGATHVLSVSGLHLAAVAVIFLFGVRRLLGLVPSLPLYVDPRAVAALLALPAIAFFTLLTGEAVATERSALMIAVALAALLVNRPVSAPATLAAAALALLLGSPLLLLDVSLQLSLASVAGIALLSRAIGPGRRGGGAPDGDGDGDGHGDGDGDGGAAWRGWARRAGSRAGNWLWRFGAATVSAIAVTAPLCAHHFGEVAPASPLGNLLLVPLVEMVVVPFGLAGAALAALRPGIGRFPLRIAGLAARAALAIAALFRARAPVWLCRAPNVLETAALVASGVLALAAAGDWRNGLRRRRWLAGALVTLGIAGASLLARDIARRLDARLRVTFLDVGQGDAALIEGPGGHVMLIDGGGSFDGSFDPGERVIEPLLRARGIGRLDVVALSHPHPDHLNGLHRVLERFSVGRLWTSGDDGRNPDYDRLIATARRRGVDLSGPAPLHLGPVAITPLGPWLDGRVAAPPGLSVNDASLVVRIDFAGRGALFAGDLEADGEGELAGRRAAGDHVASDVLKVPHHGSRTSSSPELLDAVRPALAVISLGWQNRFHFPNPEVVTRYAERGVRVLRTDRDGAVIVTVGPSGSMTVSCVRGCPSEAAVGR
jgi:competence protein ComEC